MRNAAYLLASLVVVVACGAPTTGPATSDDAVDPPEEAATATEAEIEPVDPGSVDTAQVDTAQVDTAQVDTAQVDTAQVDTAQVDTAPVDTAPVDTAPVDTAPVDTAQTDTGPLTPAQCAAQNPSQTGCRWEIGLRRVCQGVMSQPGVPGPAPVPTCVCHECRRDADCAARPRGRCAVRAGECSGPDTRICEYADDPCASYEGPCTNMRNPTTGRLEAVRPPQPPPPSVRR